MQRSLGSAIPPGATFSCRRPTSTRTHLPSTRLALAETELGQAPPVDQHSKVSRAGMSGNLEREHVVPEGRRTEYQG